MVGRSLKAMIALLVGLAALVVSACSYQPDIYGAGVEDDGTTVGLEMNNCHGDYSVSLTESADEVRVRVTDNRTPISFSGDDCSDVVTIELADPLGERRLVNDASGESISVRFVLPAEDPLEGSSWSGEDVADARAVWANQLGLNRRDPGVWVARLDEICAVGKQAGGAAVELSDVALRYIEEDANVSERADGTLPQVEEATMVLSQIADSPICGVEADPDATEAWDPTAVMAPEEIIIDPAVVKPGSHVAISFPDEKERGIHYVLESIDADGIVSLRYHLISDWGGSNVPVSYSAAEMAANKNLAIPDIGIGGPGPDVVLIPADTARGDYRLCTANSRPNVCTRVTVQLDT